MIKVIFQNAFWIYVLQVANAIIPLVTLPFATRTIGLDGVAFFGFAVALGTIASVMSEYSFDLSGIRDAAHEEAFSRSKNKVIVTRIYTQWTIFIATLAFALLVSALTAIAWDGRYWALIGAASLVTMTNIVFPFWALQSLDLLRRYATYFTVARLLSLPLIFVALPKWPSGVCYVVLLYAMPLMAVVLLMVRSVGRELFHEPYRPCDFVSVLSASFPVFQSRLFLVLYQNGGMLALGLVATPEAAGLYALLDRVRKASILLLTPISRAIYPVACALANVPDVNFGRAFRVFITLYLSAASIAAVVLLLFAPQIAGFFTSEKVDELTVLIRVSALFPIVSTATIVYGQNFLLAQGHVSDYTRAIKGTFFIYALIIFPLAYFEGAIGATFAHLGTEIILGSAFLLLVRWKPH